METVKAELFAKFILSIIHIKKSFDEVGEADSFGFGIDRCDIVFGVGPSCLLNDGCYILHDLCEYVGLGAGRDEIVDELKPLRSIPVEHDDRGGSQLTAECGWVLSLSLHQILDPIESFHYQNVGKPHCNTAVFVEEGESQQFVNGNMRTAPLMRLLNPFLRLLRQIIVR